MTASHQLITAIVDSVPEFEESLQPLRDNWAPSEPSLCMQLASLVWWIAQRVHEGRSDFDGLGAILEQALAGDDPHLRDAVATCFVESLVNRSPDKIPSSIVDGLLGPNGQEIARAWREF